MCSSSRTIGWLECWARVARVARVARWQGGKGGNEVQVPGSRGVVIGAHQAMDTKWSEPVEDMAECGRDRAIWGSSKAMSREWSSFLRLVCSGVTKKIA